MIKKHTTKLAALSVALCLTLTLMPGAAFAEGSDPPPGESVAGEADIATPSNADPATDGAPGPENEPQVTATDGISLGESSDTATPATATPGVVITIVPESEYISLSIPQGKPVTDAALLKGVTAVDENGTKIEVKVADYGGLDRENPQPKGEPGHPEAYIITYAAEGAKAVTRECFVTVGIMRLDTDGDYEYDVNASRALITKYTGSGGNITIPNTLGGYPVYMIAFGAFKDCVNLTDVVIPEGVLLIATDAFIGCSNLASVTLPDSLGTILITAFEDCSSLTSVTIPANVRNLANAAFRNCTGLENITFEGAPPQLMGSNVFANISSNANIIVPEGLEEAYETALAGAGLTNLANQIVSVNNPPFLKKGVQASVSESVSVNEAYTLDLATIFEDAGTASDSLTFKVAVDGAPYVSAEGNYSYTPTTAGTVELVFKANDGSQDSDVTYTVMLAVKVAPTYSITATPSALDFGSLESPYTQPAAQTVTVRNTGTGAVTLNQPTGAANYIIGAISPDTLDANGDTATFTVQPKENLSPDTYNETITITGSDGATATVPVNFTVGNPAPVPVLTLGNLSDDTATVGELYSKTASYFYDGSKPLAFSLAGSLPSGLSFSTANGSISGTPAIGTARDYPLTITVKETGGTLTASKGFTLTVQDAPIPVTLTVEPPEDDSVLTGYDYAKTFSVTYTGTDALRYSATGLPANLTTSAATGMITGIPALAGQYSVTVTVKEQNGSLTASASYLLTVSDVRLTLGALADDTVTAGSGYAKQITYDYTGRKTLTFSAASLPSGIAVDSATGVISGSTGVTGSHTVTVTVTDGEVSASGDYILTVNPVPTSPTTPTPVPTPSRNNSDDDDSSYTPGRNTAPTERWMTAGNITNPSRSTGKFGVRAAAWARLTEPYYHDSMSGNAVQIRTYFDSPGLFTKDTYVSGWASGADVDRVRGFFEKWFSNRIQTIHFDQPGQWETQIRVAAKLDLAGWDTKRLYFYVYDPKLNSYRRIADPEYWTDANGYLRFQTGYAGEIIISEGELEKR